MRLLRSARRLSIAGLSAGLVVACGNPSLPPAASPIPVVSVAESAAPPASASAGTSTSAAATSAVPSATPPDRRVVEKLMDSFLAAAQAHDRSAMMACFDEAGRAAEAAKEGSALTRRLAAASKVGSVKLLSTSNSIKLSGGKKDVRAAFAYELSIEEGGQARTLDITISAVQIDDKDWYVTEVREGKPPPLDLFPGDDGAPDGAP